MTYRYNLSLAAAFSVGPFLAGASTVQADFETTVTISDHRFEPSEVRVPAGEKVRLTVKNADATPEEFESDELKREKVIQGGSSAVISIGPLKPGSYPFVGEFNETTARGVIVAE